MTQQSPFLILGLALLGGCVSTDVKPREPIPVWEAEPALTIGVVDGDENYVFSDVRGLIRMSDGSYAVADVDRVRRYDESGEFLFSFGQKGSGPGEFSSIGRIIGLKGDTIAVIDVDKGTVTTFDKNGRLASTQPGAQVEVKDLPVPNTRSASLRMYQPLPHGHAVVALTPRAPEDGNPRKYKPQKLFLIGGGMPPLSLGEFAPPTMRATVWKGNPVAGFVPFTVEASIYVSKAGALYIGNGMTGEVQIVQTENRIPRSIKVDWAARPVSGADVDRLRAFQSSLATRAVERANVERFLEYVDIPDHQPFFSRVLADDSGNLWFGPYTYRKTLQGRAPMDSLEWIVTNAKGESTARITLPPRFTPLEIDSGSIAGESIDEDGVSSIQILRILRPYPTNTPSKIP